MAKRKQPMPKIISAKSQKQGGMWRTILTWYASQDKVVKTGILSLLLIAGATPFIVNNVMNTEFHAQSENIAALVITPNQQSFKRGDTITYEVHENSCNVPIDEVRLSMSYTTNKLTLQHIDFDGSAFPNQDEYIVQNGFIQLGRSSNAPLTGDQYVFKAEFTASNDSDPNIPSLSINPGTSVTDTTGTNVITTKTIIIGTQGATEELQTLPNCPTEQKQQTSFIDNVTQTLGQVVSPVLHLFK